MESKQTNELGEVTQVNEPHERGRAGASGCAARFVILREGDKVTASWDNHRTVFTIEKIDYDVNLVHLTKGLNHAVDKSQCHPDGLRLHNSSLNGPASAQ